MLEKPVIGINLDYRSAKKDSPALVFAPSAYAESVHRAGGIPIFIPPLRSLDAAEELLDRLNGIMFVGGADLDPRNDGFMLHPSVRLVDPHRETFDRGLMRLVSDRRIPVFGIGLGMQLLNVIEGGNLFLHIPEDLPKAVPHRDPLDPAHRHSLEVVPQSLMDRVYGEGEIRVNSFHHMAIDTVAPGFRVTARCPDGVVECIESEIPDWFAFGTQFHPEADTASALDQRIFEEFVDGARARSATEAPVLRLVA